MRAYAERLRGILARFPYEVVKAPGAEALETWRRLKAAGRGTPVVLGGEEDFARIAENLVSSTEERDYTVKQTLEQAATYRFPEDFRARRAQEEAEHERWLASQGPEFQRRRAEFAAQFGREDVQRVAHGPWPKREELAPGPGLTVVEQMNFDAATHGVSYAPYAEVRIVVLPTSDWTEAFAYLCWGGWNSCPYPHEHVAIMRRWRDQYGIELVGMSGDVLNLTAARQPADREAAMTLALEQYEYCADLVDQGVGTIENLAAGLMVQDWWYFWWD
ncbi:MAG: DUF4253 domain-containing protein [Pseudomonadota bacterium]